MYFAVHLFNYWLTLQL